MSAAFLSELEEGERDKAKEQNGAANSKNA